MTLDYFISMFVVSSLVVLLPVLIMQGLFMLFKGIIK